MKKPYTIEVRGREHTWGFDVQADPAHVEEWRADGVEVLGPTIYSIPEIIVNAGLTRAWCFLYDLFYLRNPLRRS